MENRGTAGTSNGSSFSDTNLPVSARLISGKARDLTVDAEELLALLKAKLANTISSAAIERAHVVVYIDRANMLDFFRLLKLDAELRFDFLVSVTAIDWLDSHEQRFEVVYHLMSLANGHRLRVKLRVPEDDAQVESVTALWSGANFMEREVWDMYGIRFMHHPDLRRILMYDEFEGYPLRKDYPVQGKQPRIPMRHPEVHNTARDMLRPELVAITPRSTPRIKGSGASGYAEPHSEMAQKGKPLNGSKSHG